MKRIILLALIFGILLAGACSKQNPENLVGQGSTVNEQPSVPAQNGDYKEFKITAKQFQFEPSTIEVNKGDKVRLIATSMDVPHGISIREYGINERLDVGKPVAIEFVADKEGTFTAFCSVVCGAGHSNMQGKLIVK